MKSEYLRIGISGGTFDPIHYGHLIAAQEVGEKLKLDKVIFIPVGDPPHKKDIEVTDSVHRLNMVRLAVEDNSFFEVSCIEVERPGYTYTIDTLMELKARYPDNCEFYYIIGADTLPQLVTWKDYRKVFSLCRFAAVMRPGFAPEEVYNEARRLERCFSAKIDIIDSLMIGISSTDIRQRVKGSRSIKYLVPENVEKYIYANGLYR